MALTTPQLEAHLGRMLRTVFAALTTPEQLERLEHAMTLLLPAGKRYVQTGTLGTQAERLEAMTTLRDAVYAKLTGTDPVGNSELTHYVTTHWASRFEESV